MRIFLPLVVILTSATSLSAKAWRDIEPLRSTRSDLIRSLNQCSDQGEACAFTVNNEDVFILFSGGVTKKNSNCVEKLPPETVMFIESRPHSPATTLDFQFAKREFIKSSLVGEWRTKFKYQLYVNPKAGLALKTREGKVVQVVYLPSSSEINDHQCSDYYDPLESFVGVFYGHVPLSTAECPQKTVYEGEQIVVQGNSNFGSRRGFEWTVSEGKIVAGQHTFSITIDTTGLGGKSITITGEKSDYDLGLTAASTCKLAVSKRP